MKYDVIVCKSQLWVKENWKESKKKIDKFVTLDLNLLLPFNQHSETPSDILFVPAVWATNWATEGRRRWETAAHCWATSAAHLQLESRSRSHEYIYETLSVRTENIIHKANDVFVQ